MSIVDLFILFWLLPMLSTALGILIFHRANYCRPEQLSNDKWIEIFFLSLAYPITWYVVMMDLLMPHLVKERSLWQR